MLSNETSSFPSEPGVTQGAAPQGAAIAALAQQPEAAQGRPRVCFHLAFPIGDIATAKTFYAEGLGCTVGRESPQAVIFGLYGHQLVGHCTRDRSDPQVGIYPRHFGLVFAEFADWEALVARARDRGLTFYQEPRQRFAGEWLEHHTVFLQDPFLNLLEFKFYQNPEAIFGTGHGEVRIGDS